MTVKGFYVYKLYLAFLLFLWKHSIFPARYYFHKAVAFNIVAIVSSYYWFFLYFQWKYYYSGIDWQLLIFIAIVCYWLFDILINVVFASLLLVDELLKPETFIGRAPNQVTEFLKSEVEPVLQPYRAQLDGKAEVNI